MPYRKSKQKKTSPRTTWSPKKKTPKAWKKIESDVVRGAGGRPTKASGAHWTQKGDGRTYSWALEVKSTAKDTFSVTTAITNRLIRDASVSSRDPVLLVNFTEHSAVLYVFPEYAEIEETYAGTGSRVLNPHTSHVSFESSGRVWKVLDSRTAKRRIDLSGSPG